MDYLEQINLDDLSLKVAELAIRKANKDLKTYSEYFEKNKSMKFKIGQVVRMLEHSIMDNLMGETDEYYVVSPREYNVEWNDEVNYYLTRSDKNTLLGARESEILAVDLDLNDLPKNVKELSLYIGGVELRFKTFT